MRIILSPFFSLSQEFYINESTALLKPDLAQIFYLVAATENGSRIVGTPGNAM